MTDKIIKLEQFEGPLSLLLQVIEQEELDITEVSLAKVTDQYIAILEAQDKIEPEELADFLLLAAKLLYIKSKVLAPDYFVTETRSESDLEKQLKMYKEYIAASKNINGYWRSENNFYTRAKPFRLPAKKFIPPKHLTVSDMLAIINEVIADIAPIARLKTSKLDVTISIKDRISLIKKLVAEKTGIDFTSLVSQAKNKTEKIVSFLAVLELVKQREVEVVQEAIFANFIIKKIT